MYREIPRWVRNLGKIGAVLFAVYLAINFVIREIIQLEFENWWTTKARPWLFSKISIGIEPFGWQIVLVGFIILIGTACLILLYSNRNQSFRGQFRGLRAPVHNTNSILTSSDIVSAVVSTRKGMKSAEELSLLVISALNNSIISRETATKALAEFGYNLVYLGDDRYTALKSGGNHE
jgi:hypothetical protein